MPGPQTHALALRLAGAENATHAVQTLPDEAVHMHNIEVAHDEHTTAEKTGQLLQAAEPVALL
jgi:hypothetical protein